MMPPCGMRLGYSVLNATGLSGFIAEAKTGDRPHISSISLGQENVRDTIPLIYSRENSKQPPFSRSLDHRGLMVVEDVCQ